MWISKDAVTRVQWRLALASRETGEFKFAWITEFPLYERDEDTGEWGPHVRQWYGGMLSLHYQHRWSGVGGRGDTVLTGAERAYDFAGDFVAHRYGQRATLSNVKFVATAHIKVAIMDVYIAMTHTTVRYFQ